MAGKGQIEPRWEKGQSGNPNGRPKGSKNRSTIAKYWLEVNQNLESTNRRKYDGIRQVNNRKTTKRRTSFNSLRNRQRKLTMLRRNRRRRILKFI